MYKLWIIYIIVSFPKAPSCQTHLGPGWCSNTTYRSESYTETCAFWLTDTCVKYRAIGNTTYYCCKGYTGTDCDKSLDANSVTDSSTSIIISTTVSVIIVLTIIITVVVCKCRKQKKDEYTDVSIPQSSVPAMQSIRWQENSAPYVEVF